MLSEYQNLVSSPLLPDDLKALLTSRTPDNNLGIALVDKSHLLNGHETEFISSWLTDEEHLQLDRYSFDKRRKEWLLGRICAKQSALDLLKSRNGANILTPLEISIGINPSGRPFLEVSENMSTTTQPDISISHSHDKAIAIAAHAHCGVDIQLLTDTLFKVKDRYCTESEAALIDSTSEDELVQLGMLWVAKESVKKCLSAFSHIGFLAIHLEAIRLDQNYRLLDFLIDEPYSGVGTVTVITHIHDRYALAVCTIPKERIHA